MRQMICVGAIVLAASACQAFGGFTKGVERFDGTQFDAQTWEPFISGLSPQPATISQADALVIDATAGGSFATYTTRQRLVPVGGGVRVDVTPLAATGGSVHLRDAEARFDLLIGSDSIGRDVYGNAILRNQPNVLELLERPAGPEPRYLAHELGATLTYEILRLSPSKTRFTAYEPATGKLLGDVTLDHPELWWDRDLTVSLEGLNDATRYDNVQLILPPSAAVPLPPAAFAGASVLAGIAALHAVNRIRRAR
jgi:hypothetical protein